MCSLGDSRMVNLQSSIGDEVPKRLVRSEHLYFVTTSELNTP